MTTTMDKWGWQRCLLALLLMGFGGAAQAAEDLALIETINSYRSEVQRCGVQASEPLPPLTNDPRLILPANGTADLQDSLSAAGYPLVNVQAITLSGPRNAQAAMQALSESFCRVLLDPQFIDIGVSQQDRDWRIVLARPLLSARLQTWQTEGESLLLLVNSARAEARQCGDQRFAAAAPLVWNAELGSAAESHSRAMANGNFFAHQGRDGLTPGDRAELAGYGGSKVGENIAAALDSTAKVVEYATRAAAHAEATLAYEEAGRLYTEALRAIEPAREAERWVERAKTYTLWGQQLDGVERDLGCQWLAGCCRLPSLPACTGRGPQAVNPGTTSASRGSRWVTASARKAAAPSISTSTASPARWPVPGESSTSSVVRSSPGIIYSGSTPRSNR